MPHAPGIAPLPQVRRSQVIVIGSGMAGLITALRLAPRPVTLLTKTQFLEGGSSALAQGGIAVALGRGDTPEDHAADTVAAGAGLTDAAMARLLAQGGVEQIGDLLAAGLPFDRGPDGTPLLGREAAHGRARILHAGGDATGRTLVRALIERVRRTPSITVMQGAFAVDLVVRGRLCGVLAHHRDEGWMFHHSPCVVLATGGIGAAYLHTTNPPEATADGLAMAARAGATLADLEFVQFHPTALAVPRAGLGEPMPLLTEALRGAGAILIDRHGRRFMPEEHPAAELAPRDVVARAVWRRVAAGEPVFLDLRAVLAAKDAHFPTVLENCAAAGFDPRREPVPVAPAAHYHMGGVLTDDRGRTSIPGLWACGEVASTGVHGANRLASNSLLESVVFAARVADDLRRQRRARTGLPPVPIPGIPAVPAADKAEVIGALVLALRQVMYENVGLRRDAAGLAAAATRLAELSAQAEALAAVPSAPAAPAVAEAVVRWGELRNLLLFAGLATLAARNRCESRGAHCRDDHPEPSPAWQRRQFLSLRDLETPRETPVPLGTPLPEAEPAVAAWRTARALPQEIGCPTP